jgi:hypothetical protein
MMQRIDEAKEDVDFYEDIANTNELLRLIEWILIAVAKYFANDNKELEVKLYRDITLIIPINGGDLRAIRVDTLIATAFIKFMYLVKYRVFSLDWRFKKLYSGNSLLFNDKLEEEDSKLIQLVIFAILVISENHTDKIVLNLGRGT